MVMMVDMRNVENRIIFQGSRDQSSRFRVQGSKVQGFKGSEVLVPGLRLECAFTRKASVSSGLIKNLAPNWQLFDKMSIL
jgi:hypothetical protein